MAPARCAARGSKRFLFRGEDQERGTSPFARTERDGPRRVVRPANTEHLKCDVTDGDRQAVCVYVSPRRVLFEHVTDDVINANRVRRRSK